MPKKSEKKTKEKETEASNVEGKKTTSETESSKSRKRPKVIKLTSEEFDKRVIELSKQGFTSEKIGETLRRQGIHPKEHNKKISIILKEKGLYTNPDIKNVTEKLERLKKHTEKNKQDKRAKREVNRIFAQLRISNAYFS